MRVKIGCAVVLVGLFASGAMGVFYTEQYEMDASPEVAAGTVNGNLMTPGSDGSGFTFAGGIGTFLDAGATGNRGLNLTNNMLIGSSNYVVDFRVKVLQTNLPDYGGTAMSFKAGGAGRGLHLDTDGVGFVSSGIVGSASGGDFTQWTQFRVVANGATQTLSIYVSIDGDVNNGNGDNVLMASTGPGQLGGTGVSSYLAGYAQSFALGSNANNGTTLSQYQLDWVRVEGGTSNVDAVWEVVPEPATLALLVLGAMSFVLRRRR